MKQPSDVRGIIERRFAALHPDWLADCQAGGGGLHWPMRIALGLPTEREAMLQTGAVRECASAWANWQGPGELEWVVRQWKVLGAQRLPAALTLHCAQDAARWAGQHERWERAAQRFGAMSARWPVLSTRLPRLFGVLADYDDADFARLVQMLAWLEANPASGLYLRQLPVERVDSKWLESRKGVLAELLSALRPEGAFSQDFYAACGLRRAPPQLRMRILDPHLRERVGGLGDIAAPAAQLAALALPVSTVYIVENVHTGLAFGDVPGAVLFMGLGYGVDLLAQVPWIGGARCRYWGDIDTHGFAILHRARHYFPAMESVLMDMETLMRFQPLWTDEKLQNAATELSLLTPSEAEVHRCLRQNVLAQNLRLEQERISWDYACKVLGLEVEQARSGDSTC